MSPTPVLTAGELAIKMQFLTILVALECIPATSAQVFTELGYDQLFPLELWIVIYLISLIALILLSIVWVWFCCTISRQNRDFREFQEALMRNRQRRLHNRRRVQEWVETETNVEQEPARRHGNDGSSRGGARQESQEAPRQPKPSQTRSPPQAISSRGGVRWESQEAPRQPKPSQTRSPPQAITYRRDSTEPRQLYVSVDYVKTLVSQQQQELQQQQQQQQQQSSSRFAAGMHHVPFPISEDSDLPSYNEIMRLNSPEFCDEAEQIQMMALYDQAGGENADQY